MKAETEITLTCLPGSLSRRVNSIAPSGIRKFFDLLASMDDVISLGMISRMNTGQGFKE